MSQTIEDLLKKNRPKISQTSINTYSSILTNLYKKIEDTRDKPQGTEWYFVNHKKILNFLESMKPELRKLRLSALVVLTEEDPKISNIYRSQMMDDIQKYNAHQREQKKTEKQEHAWVPQEQVKRTHRELQDKVLYLSKKSSWTDKERDLFQSYLILSLYVLNPPRRLEYIDMKMTLPNKDDKVDYNYIKGRKFYFTKYKTSKNYGTQVVDINPKLYTIIRKWKLMNPNQEWLLCSADGKKFTAPMITQRLNKIFGKKISVNMLRHIYISDDVLKSLPPLKELDETANAMGHNQTTQMLYKKF